MKIIIIGQQKFGESVLKKFYETTDHKIVAVLCKPDEISKPVDPIKKYAEKHKITLFQPQNYNDQKFEELLEFRQSLAGFEAFITALELQHMPMLQGKEEEKKTLQN